MVSSTSSAPNISSRGAADTTAGRIYFSTLSTQVRVPVADLVSPPPHLCSHYTNEGKNMRRWRKNLSGGLKKIPGRNNYKGASTEVSRRRTGGREAQVGQTVGKKSEKNCSTVPKIPYSISLYIEPNYTLSLYIEPNYTLSFYIEPNCTLS